MRKLNGILAAILLLCFSASAFAQSLSGYYVTAEDIQIRWPGADPSFNDWYQPTFVSVSYSLEPVGTHEPKGSIGLQAWEFYLQEGMDIPEKAVVIIDIPELPSNRHRKYELSARVRDDIGIGPWSDYNDVTVKGKPSTPVRP